MLRRSLVTRLFDGFSIRRWNDQIRPVELVEMDKNAHKMVVAWCLARYEEDAGAAVDWSAVVRGGVFELLRRVVLSDIKSPVHARIRADHPEVFRQLGEWVLRQLEPCIDSPDVRDELRRYLLDADQGLDPLSRRILDAAHLYASWWEFQILKRLNPENRVTARIDRLMTADLEPHLALVGMRKVLSRQPVADFIDLAGHLRFQVRWGQTPRMPPTSVLGHSGMVACLTWFLLREAGACPRRARNGFFGGLFHDLAESVTRDIISPVKGAVPDLPEAIGEIEQELAREEIHPLLEPGWIDEIAYYTTDEFASKVRIDGRVVRTTSDEIRASYDRDGFDPLDGELVRVADHLAAYVEADRSISMGIKTPQLEEGMRIPDVWRGRRVGGIDVGAIYADFR
jgi:putative hydrolase of HD superfamily